MLPVLKNAQLYVLMKSRTFKKKKHHKLNPTSTFYLLCCAWILLFKRLWACELGQVCVSLCLHVRTNDKHQTRHPCTRDTQRCCHVCFYLAALCSTWRTCCDKVLFSAPAVAAHLRLRFYVVSSSFSPAYCACLSHTIHSCANTTCAGTRNMRAHTHTYSKHARARTRQPRTYTTQTRKQHIRA